LFKQTTVGRGDFMSKYGAMKITSDIRKVYLCHL